MIENRDDPFNPQPSQALAGPGESSWDDLVPSDPRCAAFYRFIRAVDGNQPREVTAAAKELRRLGLSLVLLRSHGRN